MVTARPPFADSNLSKNKFENNEFYFDPIIENKAANCTHLGIKTPLDCGALQTASTIRPGK